MIVVIDGYNLLKQIFPGKKDTLAQQRDFFIKQLSHYKAQKNEAGHDIVVVFDAGPSTHATREVKGGVVVVYSGTKMSADDWILAFVARNKDKEILAITLDRALREGCKKMNADWISPSDFYTLMLNSIVNTATTTSLPIYKSLEKYDHYDMYDCYNLQEQSINPEALDQLMEQASVTTRLKPEDLEQQKQLGNKADKPSKQERRLQAKIKKLS